MPQISKEALSQFIRTGCERQLALILYPDNATFRPERNALTMPEPQPPTPGLRLIQEQGENWQSEKLQDLAQTFGADSILGNPSPQNQTMSYGQIALGEALQRLAPEHLFIAEAQFSIGQTFTTHLGITEAYDQGDHLGNPIVFTHVRPDLIQVLEPGTYQQGIQPDGTLVRILPGDTRQQLRVIDIKLTAKASQGYFAEVVYYSMTLAAWLEEQELANQFVVVPYSAIWPGSHETSILIQQHREWTRQAQIPTRTELQEALEQDLELAPFEVFAIRIRRFLAVEVPTILARPWRDLEWHVDNRCGTCEYLGEPRPNYTANADHCLPLAGQSNHLSRLAFMTQGARLSLNQAGVSDITHLAQRAPEDQIFDIHQTLRTSRTVISGRAQALQTQETSLPPHSGTSAVMPRWTDLRIYLSVDFDIGSAITVAFGLKAFWLEPRQPRNSPFTEDRRRRDWQANAYMVLNRDIQTEQRELLGFLQQIHNILDWCRQQDEAICAQPELAHLSSQAKTKHYRTKVQFYLWDSLQYEHLTRIIGRHLQAILAEQDISYLAWLFPSEELLPNPDLITRRSSITLVREVVKGLLAAPIPHYYSLLDVARHYHEEGLPERVAAFNIHPLFGVPLSDQIPSERAHEIWSRASRPNHWQNQMQTYRETVIKRLQALETVEKRLEIDLRNQLLANAPVVNISAPPRRNRLCIDGQLWYSFAKLNTALAELEVQQIRAMPPHERSARFKSARLTRRLVGDEETQALAQMELLRRDGRRVYALAADSTEIKAKVGDFNFALAPEDQPGFLDRQLAGLIRGQHGLEARYGGNTAFQTLDQMTNVTIVGLDRNRSLIALDTSPRYPGLLDDLSQANIADFENNVVLDPVYKDYFLKKLEEALKAIGNPDIASTNPLIHRIQLALGQRSGRSKITRRTPTADFLWNASEMSTTAVSRQLEPIKEQLRAEGLDLNATQWQAWEDALSYRTRLIWGPPGTGKSRTVRTIVVGAVLEANQSQRPLRILICASTYTAIDNVLLDIAADLHRISPGLCPTYRVRSAYQSNPGNIAPAIDAELNRANPSENILQLRQALENNNSLVVVGSPPEQVHNLLICENDQAQSEWFDLLIIDEASQMDVAHAILPFCAIAEGGSILLAGDPMQLPPIHQAEPPVGLENVVGSIYQFFRSLHNVPESPLETNYRSNETLVEFARQSGYRDTLNSHSPDMRVQYIQPVPIVKPDNWSEHLCWSTEFANLLNPEQPVVCFVYDDRRSSQRNIFEAEAVTSLLYLLAGRVAQQLPGERHPVTSNLLPENSAPYSPEEFWSKAVGVVTPHRAQQGLIISGLQGLFGSTGTIADAIRDAVDTVERFQGQQRDIIIASFSLGDPDQIRDEEEFLLSLNRFNVMASRARAKLIVLVSRQVVDHLANEVDVLRNSRLLKVFVESFCNQSHPATLNYKFNDSMQTVPGEIRWHS